MQERVARNGYVFEGGLSRGGTSYFGLEAEGKTDKGKVSGGVQMGKERG